MGKRFDVQAHGVLPANTGAENGEALEAMLPYTTANTPAFFKAGTYDFDDAAPANIGSNSYIDGAGTGAILRRGSAGQDGFLKIDSDAENVVIENVTIDVNRLTGFPQGLEIFATVDEYPKNIVLRRIHGDNSAGDAGVGITILPIIFKQHGRTLIENCTMNLSQIKTGGEVCEDLTVQNIRSTNGRRMGISCVLPPSLPTYNAAFYRRVYIGDSHWDGWEQNAIYFGVDEGDVDIPMAGSEDITISRNTLSGNILGTPNTGIKARLTGLCRRIHIDYNTCHPDTGGNKVGNGIELSFNYHELPSETRLDDLSIKYNSFSHVDQHSISLGFVGPSSSSDAPRVLAEGIALIGNSSDDSRGVEVIASGKIDVTMTVSDNEFTTSSQQTFLIDATDGATVSATFAGNAFTGGDVNGGDSACIRVETDAESTVTITINSGDFIGSSGPNSTGWAVQHVGSGTCIVYYDYEKVTFTGPFSLGEIQGNIP